MIINNAGSRRDVDFWTKHLQSTEENERAELKQIRGLEATSLQDALLEMQREAADRPRLKNFMYHADFNPRDHERLTEKDWERAFEIFEKGRGIPAGTPRVVYEHEKEGRVHRHVIWARLDPETMRAFPDGLDWKVAHTAARKIEKELGLQKTIGPLDREPGAERPPRAPQAWEMYRAMKTGIDPRDLTAEVTALYQQSQNGQEFQAALQSHGYPLAIGRRGLLILDSAGKEHSLAKRIEGVNTAELNAFMRDVDRAALPGVEQAKEQYRERKIAALEADRASVRDEIEWEEALAKAAIAKEKQERQFVEPKDRTKKETRAGREQAAEARRQERQWPVNPPQPERQSAGHFNQAATEATRDERTANLTGPAAQAWEAFTRSDNAKAYATALDDKGISFAMATKEEADRGNSKEAAFIRAVGNYAPRYKQGEIVIVTEPRRDHRRDGEIIEPRRVYKLDPSLAEKFVKRLDNRSRLQGIDATLKASDGRAQQRSTEREATRLAKAMDIKSFHGFKSKAKTTAVSSARVVKSIGKTLDVFGGAVESLFAAPQTPERIEQAENSRFRRDAEAEHSIDFTRFTSDTAHQQRQQENDREAARERQRDEERGRER